MSTRDSTRVLKEKHKAKCGVFGAFGDFGLLHLALQTVLFSYNPKWTIIHKDDNAEEVLNADPTEVEIK